MFNDNSDNFSQKNAYVGSHEETNVANFSFFGLAFTRAYTDTWTRT